MALRVVPGAVLDRIREADTLQIRLELFRIRAVEPFTPHHVVGPITRGLAGHDDTVAVDVLSAGLNAWAWGNRIRNAQWLSLCPSGSRSIGPSRHISRLGRLARKTNILNLIRGSNLYAKIVRAIPTSLYQDMNITAGSRQGKRENALRIRMLDDRNIL